MRPTSQMTGLALLLLGSASAACISKDSGIIDATKGCEEFVPGEAVDQSLGLDADVVAMLEASSALHVSVNGLATEVGDACQEIALDLGAENTWADLEDPALRIANEDKTGSCDAAAREVEAILSAEIDRGTHFAFSVTRGACHLDYEAQAECDRGCAIDSPCEPGAVETRCDPGNLSVSCHTTCEAGAFCEGTASAPANCMGRCESQCQGECSGVCIAEDGTRTENDPNCRGRCSSSCNGTCRGMCQLEGQALECGVNVSCRGGCSGEYSDPVCVATVGPPDCTLNQACHDACSAEVAANPICSPTVVHLYVPGGASEELQHLADLIETHGTTLVSNGSVKARLISESIQRLAASSEAVANESGDLSGKSLACAAAASRVVFLDAAKVTALIEAGTTFDEVIEISAFETPSGQ